jgi:hypothetical protein
VVVDSGKGVVAPGGRLLAQRPHQPARLRRTDASQPARRTGISATSTDSTARPQPRASTTTGRLTAQPSRPNPLGPATSTGRGTASGGLPSHATTVGPSAICGQTSDHQRWLTRTWRHAADRQGVPLGAHHPVPPDQRPHRRQVHRRQPDPAAHHHRATDRQAADPTPSPTSATAIASCYAPPTAAPLTIPPGTTTCAPPAEPSSRSAPSSLPSAPRPPIPPSAASCSPALCRCTRATPATSTKTSRQIPLVVLTPNTG